MESFQEFSAEACVLNSSISVITGNNALRVLDRCATSPVSKLHELERFETLICNPNGRIEDYITICNVDSGLLLLGLPESGDLTREMLYSGISWDEVASIRSGDEALNRIAIFGPSIERPLIGLGVEIQELQFNRWLELGNTLISKKKKYSDEVIDIIIPKSETIDFLRALRETGCNEAQTKRWNSFRISNSIRSHEEIVGRIPHEVGLEDMIDTGKGCYPGQEIHARLESRSEAKRRLTIIYSEGPIPTGRHQSEVGSIEITSMGRSATGHLAFAIIPTKASILEGLELDFGLIKLEPLSL